MQIDIKLHKDDLPDQIKLDDKKSLAIDSEFSGLNVNRDKLYLVQISTGNNDAHIVQLNRENYNAPNLKKLLINKNVEVENVSCTKIMSKLARSYSDRHGLKDLVKEFLGIEISKQFQSTDFGGVLNEKQLRYCATDVIYLHQIRSSLKNMLLRENRFELYQKAINCIHTRVELDLALFTEDIWSH